MTMVYYTDAHPKARSFVSVELPQAREQGLLGVELMDSHCIAPDCPCKTATLKVCRAHFLLDAPDWRERFSRVTVRIDCETGQLEAPEEDDELNRWIREALTDFARDQKLLKKLGKRRAQTKEWGLQNGWRFGDWSQFEPGSYVGYQEVFPAKENELFHDGPHTYYWDDQYCCTWGCSCTEMVLTILQVVAGRAEVRGYVRYDLQRHRSVEIDCCGFSEARLRSLVQKMFQQRPELLELLRERARFMGGEFAEFLHRTVVLSALPRMSSGRIVAPRIGADKFSEPEQPPLRIASGPKVGRNDPCPCGSGKKYKKCCLNS